MIRRRLLLLLLASCLVVGCGGRVDTSDTTDSPNRIAYTVLDQGYGEIWIMDADGSNARRVTQPEPAGSDGDGAKNPALSPDGTRIAYVSTGDAVEGWDGDLELHVVGVDGGEPRRLTDDGRPDRDPAWSPDGRRIAFTHYVGPADSVIEIIDADGGNRRTLTTGTQSGPTVSNPTWSPDGEQIAFARTVPGTEGPISAALYVVDAAGGDERLVVEDALSPAWSPDGTQLAFVKYHQVYSDECSLTCGIHVVNVDGTDLRRLTEPVAFDTAPAWSPDGTEIVFMSDRTGHDGNGKWGWELYVVDVDGSDLRRLTTNDIWDGDPDWR